MNFSLENMKKSLYMIKNDLLKFNEITVKNFELLEIKLNEYLTQNIVVVHVKNSLSVINKSEKDLKQKIKFVFQSVINELLYIHNADIKKFYFGEKSISSLILNLDNIVNFCNKLLKMNEERKKNELSSFTDQITEIKNDVNLHLNSKLQLKSKIKSDTNVLSKIFVEVKEIFNILKNSIKYESIVNKSINFNLYFPVAKKEKKNSLVTIIDEMNFDIFIKISEIPEELKTSNIFNEWSSELKNLFYKKRNSEYDSFKLADEFINNKYKNLDS